VLKLLKKGWTSGRLRAKRDTPHQDAPELAPLESTADANAALELALAHRRAGRVTSALECLEGLLALRPDCAPAYVEQGDILAALGRNEDAADSFAMALVHDDKNPRAWSGYGKLLRGCGRVGEAVTYLERAVTLPGAPADTWLALALALNESGNTAAAIAAYEKAIQTAPSELAGYVNLGLIYVSQLGDPARAELLFRKAIELDLGAVEPQVNLGLALHEQGRIEEALTHYTRLIASDPHNAEYRWHRACARLSIGDYSGGWIDHEARKLRRGRWREPPPFPEWDGRKQTARKLLIYAEQGIGDEIMFASCLPDVLQVAQSCIVECDSRLAELFRRSFPSAIVRGVERVSEKPSWIDSHPDITAQCAIGSLPLHYRRSVEDFDDRSAYLKAAPHCASKWLQEFPLATHRLRVGIAWKGGTFKTRRELRSIELSHWRPVFSLPGIDFFALQFANSDELQAIPLLEESLFHPLHERATDFDELAALIATLDLVITVQGTTAHLAGALGRPVWILLSQSAEWRYMMRGDSMPWYASALLVRQKRAGEWDDVFQAVAHRLANLSSSLPQLIRYDQG
jgi:tetratricopeptide (TPR) repeat protein